MYFILSIFFHMQNCRYFARTSFFYVNFRKTLDASYISVRKVSDDK